MGLSASMVFEVECDECGVAAPGENPYSSPGKAEEAAFLAGWARRGAEWICPGCAVEHDHYQEEKK